MWTFVVNMNFKHHYLNRGLYKNKPKVVFMNRRKRRDLEKKLKIKMIKA